MSDISVDSHLNGNAINLRAEQNTIHTGHSIVSSTQSYIHSHAPIESLSVSKAKLVKELRQQSGYINNTGGTLNRHYTPTTSRPAPITHQSLTNAQAIQVDTQTNNDDRHNDVDNQTDKRHPAVPHPTADDILTHEDFINELQRDKVDADKKFDIDIRFNGESEETAPSTQRQVIDQEDSASLHKYSHQFSPDAVHYITLDNLPRPDLELTHPPLRSDYPAALQNNLIPKARIAYQPTATQYTPQLPPITVSATQPLSIPLPATLSSAVQPVSNVFASPPSLPPPAHQLLPQPQSQLSYNYASASNVVQSPIADDTKEKVVVKIVPATGWYLNDAAERRSYYDAVSRGLLRENGFVFVNDVQRPQQQQQQQQLTTSQHNIVRQDHSAAYGA